MGTTRAWTQLRYHATQTSLWRTPARFVCVVAGRGSGKTELARRRVVRMLAVEKPWPDPIYFYALPTYAQARRVAWKPLRRLVPDSWIKKCNESAMTIETVFGSTLYVMGMDKPHRAEGVQWDGGVLDESSDQRPTVFDLSLLPAFSHRNAWCWRIGVPKRFGIGADEFKSFWEECDERWRSGDRDAQAFWWPSEDILTPEQIKYAKSHMDPHDYEEQYRAHWMLRSGLIFYQFDEVSNVRDDLAIDGGLPIMIGSDFNVDPMAWVICQERKIDGANELHVVDMVWRRNTNTEETLDLLQTRYGSHRAGFEFYGDATGRARKTAASMSDYIQIKNHQFFKSRSRVYYPKANPLVVNRVASCNAMFLNADGKRRCYVHPRCQPLIKDLRSRAWKPGTREPDDSGDIGHASDALGYLIHRRYPVRHVITSGSPKVHIGS